MSILPPAGDGSWEDVTVCWELKPLTKPRVDILGVVVYVCAHMHTCVYVHACAHIWRAEVGLVYCSSCGLELAEKSSLASDPQRPSCICLPSVEITSACHHAQLFYMNPEG